MTCPSQPATPDALHSATRPPHVGHRGTVLLVEDNEDNRVIVDAMLSHAGFRVLMATTGDAGVALARTTEPDVVLMDIGLPVLDGWEATAQLKGDPATAHIPVVALTAHATAEHRVRAQTEGFAGYLAKPVEPRAVLAEVERLVERR